MHQAIIFSLAAVLAVLPTYFLRARPEGRRLTLKILVFTFCTVAFLRFFLSDAFLYVLNGAWFESVKYETTDVLQSILRWGYYTNCAILPMAVFADSRFFRNVAVCFSLPFSLLSTIYVGDFMAYFLAPNSHGIQTAEWFRYGFFSLELILAIAIPIMLVAGERHYPFAKRSDYLSFLFGLPAVVAVMIPTYVPQSFLGYMVTAPGTGSTFHLLWLAILLLAILGLYYLFRFRSYRVRYNLCLFLTIVLFYHYNSLFLMGVTLGRLPVQLCNVAAYFLIICVPLKMRRMLHFCFIANVVGTLIALAMPDLTSGGFSFWNTHFILEHSLVLAIPALCMGLRIFPRLKRSSLGYAAIGFTLYFVIVLIIGTLINGNAQTTDDMVNYFYMFDLDKAFGYFPFLSFARNYHVTFGKYEIYPVVVSVVYAGFSLLCYLFYRFVRFLYRIEDDHLELRKSSIDLFEKITGRKSRRKREYID